MNIHNNIKSILFCFHTVSDVHCKSYALDPDLVRILPDPDWFSGSRTSIEQKEGFKNYLEYSFNIKKKVFLVGSGFSDD